LLAFLISRVSDICLVALRATGEEEVRKLLSMHIGPVDLTALVIKQFHSLKYIAV
jgi:hypothetical protein